MQVEHDASPVRPRLIVFAGLPGVGKSAVVDRVASATGMPVLSVDPIEEGLHRAGIEPGRIRGRAAYLVAARVAGHLLSLGQRVIIEACNAESEGRDTWRDVARHAGLSPFWIEVRCSDAREHRRRLESRTPGYPGVDEPSWAEVVARDAGFADWEEPRLVLDTMDPLDQNVATVLAAIA